MLSGHNKRKPKGGTLAAAIPRQSRSPRADGIRWALAAGCPAPTCTSLCGRPCTVQLLRLRKAWLITPCPLLGMGQRGKRQGLQSRGWGGTDGGHRGGPESPRGFWVTISTSSFHSCNGASLDPTPLGDGDACPNYSRSSKTSMSCREYCLLKARILGNRWDKTKLRGRCAALRIS